MPEAPNHHHAITRRTSPRPQAQPVWPVLEPIELDLVDLHETLLVASNELLLSRTLDL